MSLLSDLSELKKASSLLLGMSDEKRIAALKNLADSLDKKRKIILDSNAQDVNEARAAGLSPALIDRLTLTDQTITSMQKSCLQIANFPNVVNVITQETKREDKLIIKKVRVPIGVIAMFFESRPNVVIEATALALKSGNALILKGGKEAHRSNRVLFDLAQEAIAPVLPKECFYLIESREEVASLLTMNHIIDLVVPRGGSSLVEYVKKHATMPVIAHDKGLCHIFVDEAADKNIVEQVIVNAKTHRTGVCNAMETLLVHEKFDTQELKKILHTLLSLGVEIRGCQKSQQYDSRILAAHHEDYSTEYLDMKMSLKIVTGLKEAVDHIHTYGSHHTEGILSENPETLQAFLTQVDAACLVINSSTRFNDGGELGLGAELGISTSKLHAYGPMGVKELTTERYQVEGHGHIRK